MTERPDRRVVITGVGVVTAIGVGKAAFWKALKEGKSGISPIRGFDVEKWARKVGGEVHDFPFSDTDAGGLPIAAAEKAKLMALAAAQECLEDARALQAGGNFDIGVALGTTNGESFLQQELADAFSRTSWEGLDRDKLMGYPVYTIPQSLARRFNLRGPNMMIPNACAAGNFALGFAYDCIKSGRAKAMVAGGIDGFSRLAYAGFSRLKAIAPDVPRPFSKDRGGMVPGEGAANLYLETLESALERNAVPYAEMIGFGQSCDAWHITQPSAEGIQAAIEAALTDSAMEREKVAYISVHGTGTEANDSTESTALRSVFGAYLDGIPVSSVKSAIGHSMGAASAIECAATLLMMREGFITPTLNFQTADERCNVDCVPNRGRPAEIGYALKSSSAFGGNNAVVVFRHPRLVLA